LMGRSKSIELIARGVCVEGGGMLLCHSKGASNTFLPGGHVEWEESARAALEREIEEELGLDAEAGRFLGVVEHKFLQGKNEKAHHEINLVFSLEIPGIDPREAPESCESPLEFFWTRLSELPDSQLEPWPLRDLIPKWLDVEGAEGWGSTFRNAKRETG